VAANFKQNFTRLLYVHTHQIAQLHSSYYFKIQSLGKFFLTRIKNTCIFRIPRCTSHLATFDRKTATKKPCHQISRYIATVDISEIKTKH